MHRFLPLLLLVVAGSLPACSGNGTTVLSTSGPGLATITFGHRGALRVRIADDPLERARGLTGVTQLPRDGGMAFVFPEPTASRFWMKDTKIPLSIAFLDARRRIVAIREMVPCREDPCATYGAPVRYVLAVEANARWFPRHGIGVGGRMTNFRRPING